MIAWSQFAAAAPDLAAFGKQRLEKRIAYLATIRPDGSPRVHPDLSVHRAGTTLRLYGANFTERTRPAQGLAILDALRR